MDVKPTVKLVQKSEMGVLKAFVTKHVNRSIDYSLRGTLRMEGRRLQALAKEQGTEFASLDSVGQVIRQVVRQGVSVTSTTVTPVKIVPDLTSDFTEAEKMAADAIAAVELLGGFLKKMRTEVLKYRKQAARLRAVLGEE